MSIFSLVYITVSGISLGFWLLVEQNKHYKGLLHNMLTTSGALYYSTLFIQVKLLFFPVCLFLCTQQQSDEFCSCVCFILRWKIKLGPARSQWYGGFTNTHTHNTKRVLDGGCVSPQLYWCCCDACEWQYVITGGETRGRKLLFFCWRFLDGIVWLTQAGLFVAVLCL